MYHFHHATCTVVTDKGNEGKLAADDLQALEAQADQLNLLIEEKRTEISRMQTNRRSFLPSGSSQEPDRTELEVSELGRLKLLP